MKCPKGLCMVAGTCLALASAGAAADVRLEGPGTARRTQQDAMHLQAFPADAWSHVTDWQQGEAPTGEKLSGKPVLIVTWSGWHKAGDSGVRSAQSMSSKYGEQGLVVLGVHNARGFDTAKTHAERLGVKFPYANDPEGKFRAAFQLDQDPDFVVVDRAGNMRYVDIETASVEEAVREVVTESADEAAKRPQMVADEKAKALRDARKTRDITGVLAPGQEIAVEFTLPDPEVYEKVKWPYRVKGEGRLEYDKFSDKLIHEPPSMKLPEEEGYKPFIPKTSGKLVVTYFIDPKVRQFLNILPTMNNIQDVYRRDAVVIGVTAKFGVEAFNLSDEDVNKLAERNEPLVDEILRTRAINHALLFRPKVELDKMSGLSAGGNSLDEIAVCVIQSTDGVIRWIGHPNESGFRVQMDKLITVDPGVKARRSAEDRKLKGGLGMAPKPS